MTPIKEVYESYLKMLVNMERSEATIKNSRYFLGKFFSYFSQVVDVEDIEKITPSQYREFIFSLDTLSNNSKKSLLLFVNSFLNQLLADETIKKESITSAFHGGKSLKVTREEKPELTDEELTKIYLACKNMQEKFMIMFLLYTGLRESSLVRVKFSDINEDGHFKVKVKGDKLSPSRISPDIMEMYKDYKSQNEQKSEYLFYSKSGVNVGKQLQANSVNDRIKTILLRTDIPAERQAQITAHKFRHKAITKVYREFGRDAAQSFAHHVSPTTTALYNDDKHGAGLKAAGLISYSGIQGENG